MEYNLIRSQKSLNDESLNGIIKHINSMKTVDLVKFTFYDLKDLINDEKTCKALYYFLQETHISDWIKLHVPGGFEFSLHTKSCIKLKHSSYDNFYLFWFNELKIVEHNNNESDRFGTDYFIDNRCYNYLIDKGYFLPMMYYNETLNYLTQDIIGVKQIQEYFTNIKLIYHG